ncbi:NAD(P)-dependent alcohol dehydrogenase [Lysobacter brunescens]|uniref:NAD(P)-dependent alcohol dehydrogenase n=1 Tax=Lysobacter brunescens TaxID=262323 RepID=A0ABW2YFC7_9GAMM
MKAAIYRAYGSADGVRIEDVPTPEPGPGEVRIRVRAASLNHADIYMLRGWPYMLRLQSGLWRPKNNGIGLDFAGEIEKLGEGVADLRPGDAVLGEMTTPFSGRTRTIAEYLCVPAVQAVKMPSALSFEEAAVLPLAGCTAMFAVHDFGGLRPGQRVLINGAGGGIGVHAVQLAKHAGAIVTAVCSGEKASMVRELGADRTIDYRREDFTAEDIRYDVMIDLVSSRSPEECRRVLASDGRFVWAGSMESSPVLGPLRPLLRMASASRGAPGQRWDTINRKTISADLMKLVELHAEGAFRPVIGLRYPLAEVADAIRHMETGHASGKIVIAI